MTQLPVKLKRLQRLKDSSDDDATSPVPFGLLWEMAANHKTCSQRPPPVTGNKNLLRRVASRPMMMIAFRSKLHSSARVMKGSV